MDRNNGGGFLSFILPMIDMIALEETTRRMVNKALDEALEEAGR